MKLYASFQSSFRTSPVGGLVAGDVENIATQLKLKLKLELSLAISITIRNVDQFNFKQEMLNKNRNVDYFNFKHERLTKNMLIIALCLFYLQFLLFL